MKSRVGLVVLSCAVSVVTGLVLARGRGGEGPSGARKPLIGLSLDTLKEERWQSDRDAIVKKAKELGADILVQAANSDDTRQIADIQALLSNKVDALLVVPHNGAAMARAVELAHEAGVPVISYDRLITGADVDLYVSFDSVRVGMMQAQFLADRLREGRALRIVRVHGAKTDNNVALLKEGQDKVLAPLIGKGAALVVHEDWAENWKPENAKKIVNAAITRAGAFDAVLADNDGTAGGAVQALLEEGLAGTVLVTGMDADLAACQRILRGSQAMTVYKPPRLLAERAAEAAFRLATRKPLVAREAVFNGKVQVPSILLDAVALTRDNMDAVVRDGFHAREELRGAAASAR